MAAKDRENKEEEEGSNIDDDGDEDDGYLLEEISSQILWLPHQLSIHLPHWC